MRDPSRLKDFYWDADGVVEETRRLHGLGYSLQKMAYELTEKFGGILTRNAVCGKINRLGLSIKKEHHLRLRHDRLDAILAAHDSMAESNGDASRMRSRNGDQRGRTTRDAPILDRNIPPPIDLSPDEIPIKQRKQILDLKDGDCRFPYGDVGKPGFFFCGGDAIDGDAYCATHCRIAYQPGRQPGRYYVPVRRVVA